LCNGLGHAVLHIDRGDVGIGADLEGDVEPVIAGIGAVGGHVDHVVDAVDLRLDRGGDGVFDRFGIGAGIGGRDVDDRGRDLGELFDR